MVNYQNGKVYMIESLEGGCRYYGATVQSLSQRLGKHRRDNKYRPKKNITSKLVLNYPDARILLVENYPCNSKTELEAREAQYIRNNDCVNKKIPQRTEKEFKFHYYRENKEEILKKCTEYRSTRKPEIKERDRLYRQNNNDRLKAFKGRKCICECGKPYTHCHYQRHLRTEQHIFYQTTFDFIYS
jgi:hypothetical protein